MGHDPAMQQSILHKRRGTVNVYVPSSGVWVWAAGPGGTAGREGPVRGPGRTSAPLRVTDRAGGHKISKNTVELSNTIHHPGLIDVYRILHPPAAEYTFFSGSQEALTGINILAHKPHLNTFKRA